jgi:hypothetical protein
MAEDSFTPTIKTEHVCEGLTLQFSGELAEAVSGLSVPVWVATVEYVEYPDGLGDNFGFYVIPEGADNSVYLWMHAGRALPIVG